MTAPPLRKHQSEGIEWIHNVKRGLLADEPGLGKTRQAIEAFDHLDRKLVIAPLLVLEGGTWEDELNRWSRDPESWTVVPYSQLNMRKPKGKGMAPVKVLKPEVKGKWDAVVFDEAHFLKGRDTFVTWSALQIARKSEYYLAMTGTPFPNWAPEIFKILQMIHPEEGKRGHEELGSFWRWADYWFDTSPNRFSGNNKVVGEMRGCSRTPSQLKECLARPPADPCEHYLEFAREVLGPNYLRRWREDVLDLPPIDIQQIRTPMSAATKKTYLSMRNSFFAEHEGQELLAWSQGSRSVQLHMLTTSPWLVSTSGSEPSGGKLEQLKYDLTNRTRPTLVFAHYKKSVEACAHVARKLGASVGVVHGDIPSATRAALFKQFKSGDLDVLCGSLETMSEGHTLVAADMAIFVEKSFKPYRNTQAVNRCYRMGQERPVTIKEYLTPNSVDMKKERLLATKNDRQMRALTAAEFKEIL